MANSGMLDALNVESEGLSGRTLALGDAAIAGDAAGKQLSENNSRMGYSLDSATKNLQNAQFTDSTNTGKTNTANEAAYGTALDTYQLNTVDPLEREEAKRAARRQQNADRDNAIIGGLGTVAGSVIPLAAGGA
jgi:hypothetical protein